jgi:hypothetical protein
VGDMPFLDRARVAELGGVKPSTVKQYQVDSKPGGRFEKTPFPEPDGRVNRGPWWRVEREQEIRDWFAKIQDRSGVGGRPRKQAGQG